ncbi:MAG: hypothetical protein GY720_19355, partial [bacterium]|nr:hypothetical protein [bacterium]
MQTGRFLRLALAALLLVGLLPALTLANSDGFPIEPAPDPLDSPGKLITPPNTDASKPDPSIFERGNRIQLLVPSVYTTIQAAIDAAVDNDEIVVDAGVYPQQLIVDNKTITITGSGTATCFIQAPAVMTSPGDGIYSILMLINGANVQMQNLTVRGPATLASTETLVGGFVRSGSYAYFHDCGFGDIRSDTWASDSYGYALWVGSYFYTETGYADLVDNTFTNYQNRAIYCDGYNSQAFIEGNTMTGLGPHADIVQYGIRVNRGAYGFIDDNTLTGHDHTGPTYSAGAILMGYEAYGVISNNQLDANDMSFWLYENFTIANTISGNTINDTRNGIYMNNCTSGDLFSGNSITSVRYSGNGIMIYNTDDITAFGNIVDGDQGGETWGLGITGAPGVSSDNNTFTDNTVRNGLDYGAVVWSTATNSVFTGNIFENLDHGARVGMGGTTYESTGTVFHYNKFLSIANDGVWNDTFTPQIVDARLNWWGYNTGPYHAVDNPLGQGPPVSNYVLFDPWLLDVSSMTIDPASSGPINCSQDVTLGFDYNPGAFTPELRGYSIRVTATSEVSFTDADIVVYDDIIPGEYEVVEIVELGVNDYRIDWAVMGGGNGVDWVESFFDITFHSDNLGAHTAATVSFLAVEFRDLDNQPVSVDYSATATIDVDCLAPDAPVMDGEPLYTQGLSNTVDWSNPGGGAVLYYAEIATDAGFTALVGNSGWIGGLTHLFGGLTDTQIYYYRVRAKDALDNMSGWSNVESSTQDDTKPESEASALAQYHNTTSISVAYTSSDATSGVASVELFYSYEGAVYVSAGTGASPIAFTATLDGLYEFYTIATDGVSNVEDVPGTPPDASTTVDTAAPTAGTFMID